jgi:hypothetical protein
MTEPNGEAAHEDTQRQIDDRHKERVRRAMLRVPDQLKQAIALHVSIETVVRLCMEKGLFTASEYHAANAEAADTMIPHQSLIIPRGSR